MVNLRFVANYADEGTVFFTSFDSSAPFNS